MLGLGLVTGTPRGGRLNSSTATVTRVRLTFVPRFSLFTVNAYLLFLEPEFTSMVDSIVFGNTLVFLAVTLFPPIVTLMSASDSQQLFCGH